MKVLLLHPDDELSGCGHFHRWDLVIDFGRAPHSAYDEWSRQAGCRVLSLFDFADEIEDLRRTRELLQLGMECLLDPCKIDWWDVLSLEITPDLQRLILVHRLAKNLDEKCELYSSRSFPLAHALQALLGVSLTNLERGTKSMRRRFRHYSDVFSKLTSSQLVQVAQDKFDQRHLLRRYAASRRRSSAVPVVLLPSAYINVSRTAVDYAASLPEVQFLLIFARNSGRLKSMPFNVRIASLDSYFTSVDKSEIRELLSRWNVLKDRLVRSARELRSADQIGVLARFPSLIRWGIALRTAWNCVFGAENVSACLCADDSNPYSRVPLILAKGFGLPTLACHHGALDSWMAFKTQHADFYLVKTGMERDYLLRRSPLEMKRVVGPISPSKFAPRTSIEIPSHKKWLVFFTEPYDVGSWRVNEVYRELLPRLVDLARHCGLKLVFKLHPFESSKGHTRMLQKFLSRRQVRQIKLIAGPPAPELWLNTQVALTVESTVALECTALGIPVFLCAWLRHSHGGYLDQFARFGFGQILESVERFADVPQLLRSQKDKQPANREPSMTAEPYLLREMLSGTYRSKIEAGA
jgi:hypothetical protein